MLFYIHFIKFWKEYSFNITFPTSILKFVIFADSFFHLKASMPTLGLGSIIILIKLRTAKKVLSGSNFVLFVFKKLWLFKTLVRYKFYCSAWLFLSSQLEANVHFINISSPSFSYKQNLRHFYHINTTYIKAPFLTCL